MRKISFILMLFFCALSQAAELTLKSPSGQVQVTLNVGEKLTLDVSVDGQTIMAGNEMALILADGKVLGLAPKLKARKLRAINEKVTPVVPLKRKTTVNCCNELVAQFKGGYGLIVRAYDDGVAYRWTTAQAGEMTVKDEVFTMGLQPEDMLHVQLNRSYHTSCEQLYSHRRASDLRADDGVINLPILAETKTGYKVFLSESGQWDYPGMFLRGSESGVLRGAFPPYGNKKESGYIAKTQGTRTLPWRYFFITKDDRALLECDMYVRLADPCAIKDVSWIKPGQVSWDWFNGLNCYGTDVDFRAGINTPTYKYFIDFASRYKIPYIIVDDGWLKRGDQPLVPRSSIDIDELVRYGKERNVGVILWFHWTSITAEPNCLKHWAQKGVAGMKIDFMDRQDQEMVNFYEKTIQEAAELKLHIDFHGAYKPSGLEQKYPNLLSYEGVRGMEQEGGCTPDNTLYEMFIRNVSGAMDYTPGAMISMQPEIFHGTRPNNASIGTRAYQMALYIVMESGIQMLSDTPSNYYRNLDCTDFIASVPVTWDETHALVAEVGQYEVVAKKNGTRWFLGGVTNSKPRQTEVTLDFLDEGKTYTMTAYVDGVNADRQAMHYMKVVKTVKRGDKLPINMVRNGGFAAVIE